MPWMAISVTNDGRNVLTMDGIIWTVFFFLDLKDLPAVSRVCQHWNRLSVTSEDIVCRSWMKRQYPHLEKLVECVLQPAVAGTWKRIAEHHMTSDFQPAGLNKKLQKEFEILFRPAGIVAFTNCCVSGCWNGYKVEDSHRTTVKGIRMFRLFLNGKNYREEPKRVTVTYRDYDYLMAHWDSECKVIGAWCALLGLRETDYVIQKPPSCNFCICIEFKTLLQVLERIPIPQDEGLDVEDRNSEDDEDYHINGSHVH
jgi:hypothetical protein